MHELLLKDYLADITNKIRSSRSELDAMNALQVSSMSFTAGMQDKDPFRLPKSTWRLQKVCVTKILIWYILSVYTHTIIFFYCTCINLCRIIIVMVG